MPRAHSNIVDSTGYHGMEEYLQHPLADIEGSKPQQKVELAPLVEGLCVPGPLLSIVQVYFKVLVAAGHLDICLLDGDRGQRRSNPVEVHNKLLRLAYVHLQMVQCAPPNKAVHQAPVLLPPVACC